MKKSQYIQISGLVFKPSGWSEKTFMEFMERITGLSEEYKVGMSMKADRKKEDDLSESEKNSANLLKDLGKLSKKLERK